MRNISASYFLHKKWDHKFDGVVRYVKFKPYSPYTKTSII